MAPSQMMTSMEYVRDSKAPEISSQLGKSIETEHQKQLRNSEFNRREPNFDTANTRAVENPTSERTPNINTFRSPPAFSADIEPPSNQTQ